jgi:hypothetical protein
VQRLELRGEEEKAPRQRDEHDHKAEDQPPQNKGPHLPYIILLRRTERKDPRCPDGPG